MAKYTYIRRRTVVLITGVLLGLMQPILSGPYPNTQYTKPFSKQDKAILDRALKKPVRDHEDIPSYYYKSTATSMQAYYEYYGVYLMYTTNMFTPGYKVSKGAFVQFDGNVRTINYRDWSPGPQVGTGQPLDVYIEGRLSFLAVELPWKKTGLTRDGRMDLDANKRLVMLTTGYPVMGRNGYIHLPDRDVVIDKIGRIWKGEIEIDQIKVLTVNDIRQLQSLSGSIFYQKDLEPNLVKGARVGIAQGFYENANTEKGKFGSPLFKFPYRTNALAFKALLKNTQGFIKANDPTDI